MHLNQQYNNKKEKEHNIEENEIAAAATVVQEKDIIFQDQSEKTTGDNKKSMPSKEMPPSSSQSDLLAVEELVHEIKENLRLKARPPSHQHGRSSRPSPYHIPCRSWNDQSLSNNSSNNSSCNCNSNNSNINNCSECNINSCNTNLNRTHHRLLNKKSEQDIDDPYELLQTLLKSKNLVKEAVRRLQLNSISPKQRSYFYESDDESRSPMFRMCQLEL